MHPSARRWLASVGRVSAAVILTSALLHAPAQAEDDLETLADALITAASYAVPGSEFLTVLANADLIAITALKVHLNAKVKEALIEGNDAKLAVAEDLLSKSQDTEAARRNLHKKQGEDPWSARFVVTTPSFELPTIVGEIASGVAQIDASSFRTASWVTPGVWDAESPRQEPTGSVAFQATLLASGDLQVTFDPLSFALPSFPINVPGFSETGVNTSTFPGGTIVARAEADGSYSFDFASLGALVNDLYGSANPALDMASIQGRLYTGQAGEPVSFLVAAEDTLLVPGPKPTAEQPIYYAASRAIYDPDQRSIAFVDPFTGAAGLPVVAIDTFDGDFLSILNGYNGNLSDVPLLFIGDLLVSDETAQRILFAEAAFQLMIGGDLIVSGTLVDIMLDLISGDFLAQTDELVFAMPNHFLAAFFQVGHEFQLMAPVNALHLFSLTEGFSTALQGDVSHPHITLVNHNVTASEPSAFLLMLVGTLLVSFRVQSTRRRTV
jgi:hypothetical protein